HRGDRRSFAAPRRARQSRHPLRGRLAQHRRARGGCGPRRHRGNRAASRHAGGRSRARRRAFRAPRGRLPRLSAMEAGASLSWFRRFLLPGLAFKAVVIGGGYATGRELAEFFLGSGPRGGLAGMVLAMITWSAVCAVAFLFARRMDAYDYRGFFRALLGPFWIVFEIVWLCFLVLILSVVAAAAGTIGAEVL